MAGRGEGLAVDRPRQHPGAPVPPRVRCASRHATDCYSPNPKPNSGHDHHLMERGARTAHLIFVLVCLAYVSAQLAANLANNRPRPSRAELDTNADAAVR